MRLIYATVILKFIQYLGRLLGLKDIGWIGIKGKMAICKFFGELIFSVIPLVFGFGDILEIILNETVSHRGLIEKKFSHVLDFQY